MDSGYVVTIAKFHCARAEQERRLTKQAQSHAARLIHNEFARRHERMFVDITDYLTLN